MKESFSRLALFHILKVFSNRKVKYKCYLHWKNSNAYGTIINVFVLFLYVNEHFLKLDIIDICMFFRQFFSISFLKVLELLSFEYIYVSNIYCDECDNVFIITLFNFLNKLIII